MSTAIRTTPLRERMRQDLQLAGLSERTQEAYLRSVRQLAEHFHTPPDRLYEQQLREYFLLPQEREAPRPPRLSALPSTASSSSIAIPCRASGPPSSA
jgi:hypothetical protein